jgi:hypothetical protein
MMSRKNVNLNDLKDNQVKILLIAILNNIDIIIVSG